MTEEISTHPAERLLRAYAVGELVGRELQLLEPHIDTCSRCQARLVHHGDLSVAVSSIWDGLSDAVDAAPTSSAERWLVRLHVPDHVARLVAAVPALRVSWLAASALLLLLAALTSRLVAPDGPSEMFVLLAPLLPVVGVSLCFDSRWEPAGEMALVAPVSIFRLVLLRTAVVLGTCVVLSTATALTLPHFSLRALGWLVPSCGLTALSLLLSRRLNPAMVCAVAGGGWVVLASVLRSSWLTSAQGQLVISAVLMALVLLLFLFRSGFDTERKLIYT